MSHKVTIIIIFDTLDSREAAQLRIEGIMECLPTYFPLLFYGNEVNL